MNAEKPIIETNGRYNVEVNYDFYFDDGERLITLYGNKNFCSNCFHELFDEIGFKGAEAIYKKEE